MRLSRLRHILSVPRKVYSWFNSKRLRESHSCCTTVSMTSLASKLRTSRRGRWSVRTPFYTSLRFTSIRKEQSVASVGAVNPRQDCSFSMPSSKRLALAAMKKLRHSRLGLRASLTSGFLYYGLVQCMLTVAKILLVLKHWQDFSPGRSIYGNLYRRRKTGKMRSWHASGPIKSVGVQFSLLQTNLSISSSADQSRKHETAGGTSAGTLYFKRSFQHPVWSKMTSVTSHTPKIKR